MSVHKLSKPTLVLLFSLLSPIVMLVSTFVAVFICKLWYGIGIIIGIVMMIAAIPFHCKGKKADSGYITSFLLNSAANGFSLSALYLKNNTQLDFPGMLMAIIPSAAVLLFAYIMLALFKAPKKLTIILGYILNTALLIVLLDMCIRKGGAIHSFGCFALVLSMFYLCVFAMTAGHEKRSALRFISFGSYGGYILLTLIVAVALTEGDILEGLEGFIDFSGSGKKAKKNVPPPQ